MSGGTALPLYTLSLPFRLGEEDAEEEAAWLIDIPRGSSGFRLMRCLVALGGSLAAFRLAVEKESKEKIKINERLYLKGSSKIALRRKQNSDK